MLFQILIYLVILFQIEIKIKIYGNKLIYWSYYNLTFKNILWWNYKINYFKFSLIL